MLKKMLNILSITKYIRSKLVKSRTTLLIEEESVAKSKTINKRTILFGEQVFKLSLVNNCVSRNRTEVEVE